MTDPVTATTELPLRIAIVNDHELVTKGLAAMLAPYADSVVVVEQTALLEPEHNVSVALYDAFAMDGLTSGLVDAMIAEPGIGAVAVYTWNLQPELVREALDRGVRGMLSKALGSADLVDSLQRIHAGTVVVSPEFDPDGAVLSGDWPGRAEGLTEREAEIVTLITRGLSNNDIAARTYLSINSVKSYIRSAYRTMGVATRSQAILWGLDHGMRPTPVRIVGSAPAGRHDDSGPGTRPSAPFTTLRAAISRADDPVGQRAGEPDGEVSLPGSPAGPPRHHPAS